MGGGSGQLISSCEGSSNPGITIYDLASGEFRPANNLIHTAQLWQSDGYILLSPKGDRLIWSLYQFRDVERGWMYGYEQNIKFSSATKSTYISPVDFAIRSSFPDEVPVFWLPGDMGLFEEWRPEDENGPWQSILSIGDLDGQNKQTIGIYYSHRIAEGALSPDGRYFLFQVGRGDSSDMNNLSFPFLLIDLQRRTWKEISTSNFGDFSWSPDSTEFVFLGKISDTERGTYWGGLFRYDLESGDFTLLRERSIGVWSPDGEWLAVYDYNQEEDQLYLMRPDGSETRPLPLPPPWRDRRIHEMHWLPDGSGLYLRARRQVYPQKHLILYVDLTTMQATTLFEFSDLEHVSGPRMDLSPDGRWFILSSYYQRSIAYLTNWYLCNQQGCSLFSPPGSYGCYYVDWVGPYHR